MLKGISRKRKQFLSCGDCGKQFASKIYIILKFFHAQSDNTTFNYIYLEDQNIKSCWHSLHKNYCFLFRKSVCKFFMSRENFPPMFNFWMLYVKLAWLNSSCLPKWINNFSFKMYLKVLNIKRFMKIKQSYSIDKNYYLNLIASRIWSFLFQ